MIRSLLGVLAGLVLAMAVIFAVQSVGHAFFPPPPGLDPRDREAFEAAVAAMPVMALIVVLIAYAIGTFAGAWLAATIVGSPFIAFLVGGVLTLAGMSNVLAVPHPTWFIVCAVLVFLPSAWLGSRLASV